MSQYKILMASDISNLSELPTSFHYSLKSSNLVNKKCTLPYWDEKDGELRAIKFLYLFHVNHSDNAQ